MAERVGCCRVFEAHQNPRRVRETKIDLLPMCRRRGLAAGVPRRLGTPYDATTRLLPFGFVPAGTRVAATPIQIVFAQFDESVKGRPRIIANASYVTVLARVPMHVIDESFQVVFVAAGMFPEPLLPDAAVPPLGARA